MMIEALNKRRSGQSGEQRPAGCRRFRKGRWAALTVMAFITAATAGDTLARGHAYPTRTHRMVVDVALRSAVPPELALAVARVGRDQRLAGAGVPEAVGIMQVVPSVARAELGVRAYDLGDGRANAGIAVALLERLYRRHGERWDLALSHYRGGPLPRCESGAVAHAHTVDYVADVMEWWRRYQKDGTVAALTGEAGNDPGRGAQANSVAPGGTGAAGRVPLGHAETPWSRDGATPWSGWEGRFRSDDRPAYGNGQPRRFF
jgi:hypothetical protein